MLATVMGHMYLLVIIAVVSAAPLDPPKEKKMAEELMFGNHQNTPKFGSTEIEIPEELENLGTNSNVDEKATMEVKSAPVQEDISIESSEDKSAESSDENGNEEELNKLLMQPIEEENVEDVLNELQLYNDDSDVDQYDEDSFWPSYPYNDWYPNQIRRKRSSITSKGNVKMTAENMMSNTGPSLALRSKRELAEDDIEAMLDLYRNGGYNPYNDEENDLPYDDEAEERYDDAINEVALEQEALAYLDRLSEENPRLASDIASSIIQDLEEENVEVEPIVYEGVPGLFVFKNKIDKRAFYPYAEEPAMYSALASVGSKRSLTNEYNRLYSLAEALRANEMRKK